MTFSEEVRNWYYVGDEIPAKEWADRIAELEQALLDQHSEHAEIYNATIRRALDAEAELEKLRHS